MVLLHKCTKALLNILKEVEKPPLRKVYFSKTKLILVSWKVKMKKTKVEDYLRLGELIENSSIDSFKHREQRNMPEWQGADVQITSDFEKTPQDWSSEHDLWVRTLHATHLTWLFFELKHVFSEYLSYRNKYGFYEALGQSALKYLSTNQPEPECPSIESCLIKAFGWLNVEEIDYQTKVLS